jgi:pre-mRNA-splicing helicase BRR2
MLIQAMWYNQSPLLQVPFMVLDYVKEFKDRAKVEDIADLMNMSDENLRKDILQVTDDQLAKIADVCNRHPYVDVTVPSQVHAEEGSAKITVTLKRSNVEEDELDLFQTPVTAEYYPLEKEELWWIIVGDPRTNKLLSIKRVMWKGQSEVTNVFDIEVSQPKSGNATYKVYLFCDSYVGCDQEEVVEVKFSK